MRLNNHSSIRGIFPLLILFIIALLVLISQYKYYKKTFVLLCKIPGAPLWLKSSVVERLSYSQPTTGYFLCYGAFLFIDTFIC